MREYKFFPWLSSLREEELKIRAEKIALILKGRLYKSSFPLEYFIEGEKKFAIVNINNSDNKVTCCVFDK